MGNWIKQLMDCNKREHVVGGVIVKRSEFRKSLLVLGTRSDSGESDR